jgi:large subunit ribosomal protein L30
MSVVKIKYVHSVIKESKDKKATIQALGFSKLNQIREHNPTPQILGMIKKVSHLVEIL